MLLENSFIALGVTYVIGIISPGPSLLLVAHNSLQYPRGLSFWTALGVVTGTALQAGTVLWATGLIIEYTYFLQSIKIGGACYLFYLGFLNIFKKTSGNIRSVDNLTYGQTVRWNLFIEGFLIEIFNPLALTFFLALFTIFIDHQSTTYTIKLTYWSEIVILGGVWFFTINSLSASKGFKYMKKYQNHVDKVYGMLLLLLGIMFVIKA